MRATGTSGEGRVDGEEAAKRDELALLARVAQATESAVIITDAEGITVWVNQGFTRMTGYSLAEAVGRKPGHLLQGPDTDRGELSRISAALRSRQRIASELINYAKDGRRYWVGMKIEPMIAENGELEGFMALEADITNRHEERLSIQQLTHRFNMASRAARVGVFERDYNGDIRWWNEVMFEIFGQDPATFKPSKESWLQLVHPDDRERMRQAVAAVAQGQTSIHWHYRIIRPDGDIRHLRSIGALTEPNNKARKYIFGITLDITERIRAQEREQAMQRQLLESSHQAGMAEIAAGVLHNVGNLLNSLGIANATARREMKNMRFAQLQQATALLCDKRDTLADFLTHDERGRHLPEYLNALSEQMSSYSRTLDAELETTEQLLRHLSNVISAQQELAGVGGRREKIRLDELLETALLVQGSELAQIEIVRQYDQLPEIVSDRHKLLQIMINLLSNARDALEPMAEERGRIVLKLSRDGEHVRVTVEDSGVGMSEEVLSQLWQFGFTTKKKGHGFGLHNSANAAHQIGGALTAHSDGAGRGSRFVLRIPIDSPEPMLSGEAA